MPPSARYFLRVLWKEDGLTQREPARRVGIRKPTAVITLRGMEAAGHALREVLLPAAPAVNTRAGQGLDATAFISLLR